MRFKARFNPADGDKIKLLEKQLRQVVFGANLDLYNALRDPESPYATPIDTGFARASWWGQANGQPSDHPAQPAAGSAVALPPIDPATIEASVGGIFSLVNNAAYIGRLEEGHSPQNKGFVAGAANAYDDFVNRRVLEIKAHGGISE